MNDLQLSIVQFIKTIGVYNIENYSQADLYNKYNKKHPNKLTQLYFGKNMSKLGYYRVSKRIDNKPKKAYRHDNYLPKHLENREPTATELEILKEFL